MAAGSSTTTDPNLKGWSGNCKAVKNKQVFTLYRLEDRKSTRLNSSHPSISYAVFCLKKKSRRISRSAESQGASDATHSRRIRDQARLYPRGRDGDPLDPAPRPPRRRGRPRR